MSTNLRAAVAVPVLLLVLVIVALFVLDGRGEGESASTADTRGEPTRTGAVDPSEVGASKLSSGTGSATPAQRAAIAPLSRDVISTGQVSLRSSSIRAARADVLRLVASWNGTVSDEQTDSDDRGRIVESTMTLRVPTAKFSVAMSALAEVAKVQRQSRTSEDVSTEVIDNGARVRAAERSIRQIESLLGRAKSLGDLIAVESDLARRQADLGSLKSQQAWLADQTSLSTITVTVNRSVRVAPAEDETRGFLTGLEGGWTTLTGATVVLLTVMGAALPFAVLVLLLGVPLWVVVRRRSGAPVSGAPARSA